MQAVKIEQRATLEIQLPHQPLLPNLQIHHVSISVPDITIAIAWYEQILGFRVEQRFAIEEISARGAFLVRDPLRIELWQVQGNLVPESRKTPTSDLQSGGTKHMAFLVPELQRRLGDLVAHGVDIAAVQRDPAEPMLKDDHVLHLSRRPAFAVFIRDPAGTLIELLDRGRIEALASAH